MNELPPLPVLTKAERRKNCGACGADIRKNRESRTSGLCAICRWSVEIRGRPLVPFDECKCDCSLHNTGFFDVDDGACGDPVNRHVPICCFKGEDAGDPAFRSLFLQHERSFIAQVEAERERARLEREARWSRERASADEVISEPRHIHIDWSKSASDLGNESERD